MDISESEYQVMEALWQGHPCSSQEVVRRLSPHTDWHERTVKTLLGRLVKKDAVDFEKDGRRYLYFPIVERQAIQKKESHRLLNRLFGGKISPLVATFVADKELDKEDIQALKDIIQDWEQRHD